MRQQTQSDAEEQSRLAWPNPTESTTSDFREASNSDQESTQKSPRPNIVSSNADQTHSTTAHRTRSRNSERTHSANADPPHPANLKQKTQSQAADAKHKQQESRREDRSDLSGEGPTAGRSFMPPLMTESLSSRKPDISIAPQKLTCAIPGACCSVICVFRRFVCLRLCCFAVSHGMPLRVPACCCRCAVRHYAFHSLLLSLGAIHDTTRTTAHCCCCVGLRVTVPPNRLRCTAATATARYLYSDTIRGSLAATRQS